MEGSVSTSIVHFGKGNYGAIPEGRSEYVDPTIARPRNVIPAARLMMLRRIKAKVAPAPVETPITYRPGPILSMRDGQCRYPIDDRLFCGAKSIPNRSWCSHHDDIVFGRKIMEAAE